MSKEYTAWLPDWTVCESEIANELPIGRLETPIWTDEQGSLLLSKSGESDDGRFRLRLADQLSVDISFDERLVRERSVGASVEQATRQHFLVDQVLPRILGQMGKLVLHAAAVRNGDQAFLLLGKSGSGKSTLAASFDRAGFPLLGDDALVVTWSEHKPLARAIYPSLRLFPDSIEALLSDGTPTAPVAHYTPKLRVDVPLKDGGESRALPIRAFFVLGAHSPGSAIFVQRESIADACMALVENSFVLDPTDKARASGRLEQASRLAGQVPAFNLCYRRAYSRLGHVRTAILAALGQAA